jgi:hypothetical protein
MISFIDTIILMGRHKKTYEAIFKDPVLSGILWSDIEALLLALGAELRSRFASQDCSERSTGCFS